ncbi:MAG: hypothetical protein M1539_04555 [Actinobacteria bacterium]|nr:hypothetical protein [Actinomycetota bacterium]MCL5883230.1 hypothetical protein [Actinomycetota bacterium]
MPGAGRERPPVALDVEACVSEEAESDEPHPAAVNATARTRIAAAGTSEAFVPAIRWEKGLRGFRLLIEFSIFPI